MTTLPSLLRYRKRLFWILLAVLVVSLLWVFKVEIAYRRNEVNVPMNFHLRCHHPPELWRA